MTVFRPCIDLHNGQVKQIVGSTLKDGEAHVQTNFVAPHPPAWYGDLYRRDRLAGGHVIKLGPGNEEAARAALSAWPDGLHLGGGINEGNARSWIDGGAQKVIVTSVLFTEGELDMGKVEGMAAAVGVERLVIDLSCKRTGDGWHVATNRWQTVTRTPVNGRTLEQLAGYCSEYLVHAADVEGKCEGIDTDLVQLLGDECPIPCVYAGGAKSIGDLQTVKDLSSGRVDLTYGSALDLFGGNLVQYADCVRWNNEQD